MEVDVTRCRNDVVLRVISVRTISRFGGSQFDVSTQLMGLTQESDHCPLPQSHKVPTFLDDLELLPPQLVFVGEFAPDYGEFLKLAAEACIACNATSVTELALLLSLAFPGSNPDEIHVFGCNKPDPHCTVTLHCCCHARQEASSWPLCSRMQGQTSRSPTRDTTHNCWLPWPQATSSLPQCSSRDEVEYHILVASEGSIVATRATRGSSPTGLATSLQRVPVHHGDPR